MTRTLIYTAFALTFLGITGALAGDVFTPVESCPILTTKDDTNHGGGLNSCGCHEDHRTGICHCHRAPACGC